MATVRRLRFAVLAAALLITIIPQAAQASDASPDLVLRVGMLGEMKTRNLLQPAAFSYDSYTEAVLFRVYGSVLLRDPGTGGPLAYVAKGVDYDEDGIFETAEYNVFGERENATTPLEVVVYYDFNGVMWHDGTQMTVWDLLFSYHLTAFGRRFDLGLAVLYCGGAPSYESGGRCLSVEPHDADPMTPGLQHSWEGEGTMVGIPGLRAALRFRPSGPSIEFYHATLRPIMFPMHEWSRSGGGRHADFGCAIWIPPDEATAKGLGECGSADTVVWGDGIAPGTPVPGSHPFASTQAESWTLRDEDVIGHGPFRFGHWTPGREAVVLRNEDFYTGEGYDSRLAAVLQRPAIDEIRFLTYRTEFHRAIALREGEIDVMPLEQYTLGIAASAISDALIDDPRIQVLAQPEHGYGYVLYNMRKAPWGYEFGDPTRDVGFWLRRAVAHAVPKGALVDGILNGFGVVAYGFVSPGNPFWYNNGIPKSEFDLGRARDILDSPEARANGTGPDPPGPCSEATPAGCRSLTRIGTGPFELMVFRGDYDRVRYEAGIQVGEALRSLGLNAAVRLYTPTIITPPWTWRNEIDLAVLSWRIGPGEPVDYLHSFFHSANAPMGQNYAGFQNPEFDAVIEAARWEVDRARRRDLVFEAQRLLADHRPSEPLYYPAFLEAYRQDRFVNWTIVDSSVWNDWSLLRIRPPDEARLEVRASAPAWVHSGETRILRFAVRDSAGLAVGGATLAIEVASAEGGPGTLAGGGVFASVATAEDGTGTVSYQAPLVEASRAVTLRVSASHAAFATAANQTAIIRVVPLAPGVLRVRLDLPAGDVGYPGMPIRLHLEVRVADGVVIDDAFVSIRADPPGVVLPAAGPSGDVQTVTAMFPGPGVYTITANATRAGYDDGSASITVWVVERGPRTQPLKDSEAAVDARVLFAATLAPGIAISAAIVVLRRRIRDRPGRS